MGMPDLFFYRDPEEAEKEEPAKEEWGGEELTAPVTDWSADPTAAAAPVDVVPAVPIAAPAASFQVTEDWQHRLRAQTGLPSLHLQPKELLLLQTPGVFPASGDLPPG